MDAQEVSSYRVARLRSARASSVLPSSLDRIDGYTGLGGTVDQFRAWCISVAGVHLARTHHGSNSSPFVGSVAKVGCLEGHVGGVRCGRGYKTVGVGVECDWHAICCIKDLPIF